MDDGTNLPEGVQKAIRYAAIIDSIMTLPPNVVFRVLFEFIKEDLEPYLQEYQQNHKDRNWFFIEIADQFRVIE